MVLEHAKFTVDGDEVLGPHQVEQEFLLLRTGVTGHVDGRDGIVDDVCPALE